MTWLQLQNGSNSITAIICGYSPNFTGELLIEWLVVFHAKKPNKLHISDSGNDEEVDKTGGRLTKGYDVTVQRYCNLHARIQDSKMHMLRCMGSKFCVKFQGCPLKFHRKFWTIHCKYAFYGVLKTLGSNGLAVYYIPNLRRLGLCHAG